MNKQTHITERLKLIDIDDDLLVLKLGSEIERLHPNQARRLAAILSEYADAIDAEPKYLLGDMPDLPFLNVRKAAN